MMEPSPQDLQMDPEEDNVVRNCTCCRNVIDPGLICVRQHLKPTTTKELNPCNCFCDEDDENIDNFAPPPGPSTGRGFQPPQQIQQRGSQQLRQSQQQPQRMSQQPQRQSQMPQRQSQQPQQRMSQQPQQRMTQQQRPSQPQQQQRFSNDTRQNSPPTPGPQRRNSRQSQPERTPDMPGEVTDCPESPYKPWCDEDCIRAMGIERIEACRRQSLQPTFRGEITNGPENWTVVSDSENCQRNLCLNDTVFSGGLYSTASPQPCNLINVATGRKTYKCCPNCKPTCFIPPEVFNPPFLHATPQPCRMATIGMPPETVNECKETDDRAFGMNCPPGLMPKERKECKPQKTGRGADMLQLFNGVQKKICPRCEKPVYHAEAMQAAGTTWHKSCYTCACCGTILNPQNIADRPGDNIYCKLCYKKNFGPQGYGYGGGAGTLQIQTVEPCLEEQ